MQQPVHPRDSPPRARRPSVSRVVVALRVPSLVVRAFASDRVFRVVVASSRRRVVVVARRRRLRSFRVVVVVARAPRSASLLDDVRRELGSAAPSRARRRSIRVRDAGGGLLTNKSMITRVARPFRRARSRRGSRATRRAAEWRRERRSVEPRRRPRASSAPRDANGREARRKAHRDGDGDGDADDARRRRTTTRSSASRRRSWARWEEWRSCG